MVVQPFLLLGSEVCAFTRKSEKRFIIVENKILQKIFGPNLEGNAWKNRKTWKAEGLIRDQTV